MSSVLVGMFETQVAAAKARGDLMSAGFTADAVTMMGGDAASSSAMSSSDRSGAAEPEQEGTIARFFHSIFGSDDATDDRRAGYADTYAEALKRGSFGVSVTTTDDDEIEKAEDILNDAGAIDVDEQSQSWRKDGWTGRPSGMTYAAGSGTAVDAGGQQKLQEVQEELKVGKRAVSKGGVRIFSRMTEVPVSETVRLREEHVDVQRTAVDRPATEQDFAAFREGSVEVRGMAEEAVVSKTARVTGEVSVGKTASERDETVRDTVRQTKVEVEQLGDGTSSSSSSASTDPTFGKKPV